MRLTTFEKQRLGPAIEQAKRITANRRRSKGPGLIYLVQCDDLFKIGIAADVALRMGSLQTGNPFPIVLRASWQCLDPATEEEKIHELFRHWRVRGEWFKLPEDIAEAMAKIEDITDLCVGRYDMRETPGLRRRFSPVTP